MVVIQRTKLKAPLTNFLQTICRHSHLIGYVGKRIFQPVDRTRRVSSTQRVARDSGLTLDVPATYRSNYSGGI